MDATTSSVVVTLTEDDIQGAKLDISCLEKYTIPELQWWLLCRGITTSTSWKKSQYIAKFVT